LAPAALVHDGALVDAAADKVDEDGDEGHDAKDAAGAQGLLGLVDAAAGKGRAALEEVSAVVDGGDKRDARLGEGVALAQQGDDGRLAALGGGGLLVLILALVLVAVLVLVVIITVDDLGQGDRAATGLGGRGT
jgi:hypothetical protein